MRTPRGTVTAGVLIALLLAGCCWSGPPVGRGNMFQIADLSGMGYTVGSKPGERRELLCWVALAALEAAEAAVDDECDGRGDVPTALGGGEIDLFWEDTGTAAARAFLDRTPAASDAAGRVPGTADATDAVEFGRARPLLPGRFAASADTARRFNLQTLTDVRQMAVVGEQVTWCRGPDVTGGAAELADVTRRYRMPEKSAVARIAEPDARFGDAARPPCTVFLVEPVEELPVGSGLVRLRDDQAPVAPVQTVLVMRDPKFQEQPRVEAVLGFVTRALDGAALSSMGDAVADGVRPVDAARDWVRRLSVPER